MPNRNHHVESIDPLRDFICLITGGGEGIGRALAKAFASAGAQVYACDISEDYLHAAGREIEDLPYRDRITLDRADVTDRQQVEQWIGRVPARSEHPIVFVHNAAFIRWGHVQDMSVVDAERSMSTGFHALVYGVKSVLPLMRTAGGGNIVAIGSAVSRLPVKGPSAAYAATKAAIEAYTEILRTDLQREPIQVTLVRPGVVAGTDFFGQHVRSDQLPRIADFLPPTAPETVAAAVVDAVRHRRSVVDVPGYLPALYRAYTLSPTAFRRLAALGGPARRNYAEPKP
jgi:NAD(P)-dependent dehydrogenase (short-subunit alcohol dehydrogenase family)